MGNEQGIFQSSSRQGTLSTQATVEVHERSEIREVRVLREIRMHAASKARVLWA